MNIFDTMGGGILLIVIQVNTDTFNNNWIQPREEFINILLPVQLGYLGLGQTVRLG